MELEHNRVGMELEAVGVGLFILGESLPAVLEKLVKKGRVTS